MYGKYASRDRFFITSQFILYGLPIIAVLGVLIPTILNLHYLSILGCYLALPMILAALLSPIYLDKSSKINYIPQKAFIVLLISFVMSYLITIILLYLYDVRPYIYYIFIGILVIIIFLQIMQQSLTKITQLAILTECCLLCINLIWGVTLKYYYFIGRTDIFTHAWLGENLLTTGFITETFNIYKPFPLWHILSTITSLYSNLSIPMYKTMFITNGIIYILIPVFVYLISIKLIGDNRLALLSGLITSFYPTFVFYGMSSIARSAVTLFELILIYLLLCTNNNIKYILILFFTLIIIMFHTASAPFVIIILLIIYILQKIYAVENNIFTYKHIIMFLLLTLFYWIYNADIFNTIVRNAILPAPTGLLTKSIFLTPLTELFNYMQYSLLLFFLIVGALIVLRGLNYSDTFKLFSIIALISVAVSFPGPSMLFNKLAENLNIVRFEEYTYFFIAIGVATGIYSLYNIASKYSKIFIISILFLLVILCISNDFIASDNPLVKRPFYTYYLTNEEISSLGHLSSFSQGYIMTDYIPSRYLACTEYSEKSHILEYNNTKFYTYDINDIILIRSGELLKRPLKLYTLKNGTFKLNPSWSASLDYYYHEDLMNYDNKSYNKIYESNNLFGLKIIG